MEFTAIYLNLSYSNNFMPVTLEQVSNAEDKTSYRSFI